MKATVNATKVIEKWWDEVSGFYQAFANLTTKKGIYFGAFSPNENELQLLGSVKNKKVLELGCGGGQNSIAFVKEGAICTGVDVSREQLEYARRLAKKEKVAVSFIKDDIQHLKKITKKNHFDIVFSSFALEYIPDLKKCFSNVCRVLKKSGLFVFSIAHPFSLIVSRKTHKIVRSYYSQEPIVSKETWDDKSKHTCIMYNRKISDIYRSLRQANFFVEDMLEPLSFKDKTSWKGLYSPDLVKLIAPTLIFKTRKLK